MACYTEIRFPKALPWKTIEDYVRPLLTKRFGEEFKISTTCNIKITFNEDEWQAPGLEYFTRGKKNIKALQWSDNSFRQLDGGWFANWLSGTIADHFGAMIYSESLDEKYKPTFHKDYPRYNEWLRKKNVGFLTRFVINRLIKEYKRDLKKNLPKRVMQGFEQIPQE